MSDDMEMGPGPSSSSSKYKGVRKRKWGKWVSEIRLPNSRERIWLGSYDSAEKAARAFDAAQFCLRGRNARFNFPDDPPNIAGGRGLTNAEIQDAAARFANSAPDPPPGAGQGQADRLGQGAGSPSASDGTVVAAMEHDFGVYTMEVPFFDPSRNEVGSGYYGSDYGIFPGFDEFNNDYFGASMVSGSNYGEESFEGQDYCLWNF
ncbi:hypothetical protein MLD38_014238 [Melastoma candidum]|uniref:Uncharacterized protein n=1 Tax=Melastoma candidum TaxID=119954 RepID=A0ACB9RE15_9MYRT|nr:hypothetical protein MLD38_014238 [Melastoma candidum]